MLQNLSVVNKKDASTPKLLKSATQKVLVFRKPNRRNFTMVPNELTLDHSISSTAYRLLRYCTSKHPNWEFNVLDAQKKLKRSRSQIYRLLSGLIKAGYCKRTCTEPYRGRYSKSEIRFADTPIFLNDAWSENPDGSKAKIESTSRISDTPSNTDNYIYNLNMPRVRLTSEALAPVDHEIKKEQEQKSTSSGPPLIFEFIRKAKQGEFMDTVDPNELKKVLLIKLSFMLNDNKLRPNDNVNDLADRMSKYAAAWKDKGMASLQEAVDYCFDALEARNKKTHVNTQLPPQSPHLDDSGKDLKEPQKLNAMVPIGALLAKPDTSPKASPMPQDSHKSKLEELKYLAGKGKLYQEMLPEDLSDREKEMLRYLSLKAGNLWRG